MGAARRHNLPVCAICLAARLRLWQLRLPFPTPGLHHVCSRVVGKFLCVPVLPSPLTQLGESSALLGTLLLHSIDNMARRHYLLVGIKQIAIKVKGRPGIDQRSIQRNILEILCLQHASKAPTGATDAARPAQQLVFCLQLLYLFPERFL